MGLVFLVFLFSGILFAGCQTARPTPIVETVVVTQEIPVPGETIVVIITPTPQPEVRSESEAEITATPVPDTLVVCMGQEPLSLYPYNGGTELAAANTIFEAIYDGPMDALSFGSQPVIVEKIPSLADGDAVFQQVEVRSGDPVVDAQGNLTTLEVGTSVYPVGCSDESCTVLYDGATSITMEQMVVTFKLLPGLQWSDGFPLTIHDSVYAFTLAADPATPLDKSKINRTESYEALDDVTVQWVGVPGYKDPAYATNFWSPLPEHVWGEFSAEELLDSEESNRAPMGWGPYVIDEWEPGESITLSKNDFYFRAQEGLPKFEHVVFQFVGEEPNVNIARVLSGECDILDPTIRLGDQTELLLELNAKGLIKASFQTTTIWEHIDFGIAPASYDDGWTSFDDRPNLFGDIRTRQAIAMCMDRQKIVDEVFFGESVVLDTYLPSNHPLFNDNASRYSFDVNAASLLLEEVGWVDTNDDGVREYTGDDPQIPSGTLLAFTYLTVDSNQQRQQIASILAESMAQCGIRASLEQLSLADFNARTPESLVFGRQFDMVEWSTNLILACQAYLAETIPGPANNWNGLNISGYNNPNFDAVCKLANQHLPGEPATDENQLQAQEIFAEELPAVPLFLYLKVAATHPEICNFILDPTESDFWNIEELAYGNCGDG